MNDFGYFKSILANLEEVNEKQEENAKDDVSNALFEKNGGNAGVKPEQNTNSGVQSGNGAVSDGN